MLIFSLFIFTGTFISMLHNSAPLIVLGFPVVLILISVFMIRAGRVRREVYYEEKTEVSDNTDTDDTNTTNTTTEDGEGEGRGK